MQHSRSYRNGKLIDFDFALDQISEQVDAGCIVWVDLVSPDRDTLEVLAVELGLHELAVEDAINLRQRPKLDRYPDHLFLAAYATRFDVPTGAISVDEIAAFVTDSALITIRRDESIPLDDLIARWDDAPELAKSGVPFLVHGLLDFVVDGHFEAVQQLDEEIEELANQLFLTTVNQETIQKRSFKLRQSLVLLRRVVLPMREVLNTFLRRDLHLVDDNMGLYFQDVYDHVLRASEWTETLRDLVTSMLETNLAIQGNRLNIITKKVTGYAAIIAVPTAVTGFYGQNVPYPGFGQIPGLLSSIALIVGLSALLFVLFKRNDWI
ncbi:MAG: magnesium transporter CorA family protein [Acidobacteria bacterium]|nr:magnesium transporter CorA family protein [Acidobacteriota bacterium]